jgi:putative nucleotidyltransferase with HDIG domain
MPVAELADPQTFVKNALKRVTSISTLPEVTSKIISTVENPNSTAASLHRIVAHDPALATRILKVVNSAFYGLPGQVGSIERAIVLLGLNAVKNIAVAASIGQLFRGATLCDGYTAKDLWTHCIAVAVASRDLAKQTGEPIADEAFLAGMIHDIGLLVSLQLFPEQLREVCEKAMAGGNFTELERTFIGVDHQQLGMGLAEQWKFPLVCQRVAGHHHAPQTLPEDNRRLVAIVHVADTISCKAGLGFTLTAASQTLTPELLEELKIEQAWVDHTTGRLPMLMETANALLG